MGQTVGILSGKGGTGKTSVCAGVAQALAQDGERVLCVDCDVGLGNLDISLGLTELGGLSFLDVSEGGYALDQALRHPIYPNLSFLAAPMNRPSEQIDPAAFLKLMALARKEYGYVLLDAPAGVDAGFRLVADAAERFLLVTGPGPAALRDAAQVGAILERMGKTDVRLVVNRVDKDMLSLVRMTIDDVMDAAGLPLAGVVLEDPAVTLAASFGKPILQYNKRSPAAKAYGRIARRLQGFPAAMPLR